MTIALRMRDAHSRRCVKCFPKTTHSSLPRRARRWSVPINGSRPLGLPMETMNRQFRCCARASRSAPETPELIATLERYTVALEHRRLLRSLRESFASHEPLDLEDTRDQLATLRQQSPDEFAKLEAELADARSGQAVANASGSPPDIGRLAGYLEEIRALFPARHTSLAKRVGAELAAGTKKLSVANPLAAHALLDAALAMLPDDPGLRSLRDALPATELLLLTDHLKAGRLSAATEALEVARAASVETVALG